MRDIPRYLEDELARIESTLSFIQEGNGIALTEAPAKPVDGMVVIADGVLWNPGFGPGLYKYNGTLALWEIFITSGTSNVLLLDDLSDADTTTSPPVVNDSLKWNGTNWVPYTPSGGASPYWDDDGGSPVTLPSATGSKALALGDGTVAAAISSTVSGGLGNTIASGSNYAVVGGGLNNTLASGSFYAAVGGGTYNSISASYCTISGGANNSVAASSIYCTIGGGTNNSVDVGSAHCTIGGSYYNSIASSSTYSTISGGANNSVAANTSCSTIPGGRFARTTLYGQFAYASGRFSAVGDAQLSNLLARGESTSATVVTLFLDGGFYLPVIPA